MCVPNRRQSEPSDKVGPNKYLTPIVANKSRPNWCVRTVVVNQIDVRFGVGL